MKLLIIGNIIILVASLVNIWIGFWKKKNKILYFQTISFCLYSIGNFLLKSNSGGINNIINIVRNIICYKNKLGLKVKIIITITSTILSIMYNNLGIIGYLPLISSLIYLWFMDVQDIVKFKILIIITNIFWIIHDIYIKAYASLIFDIGNILANFIMILKITKKSKV